MRCHKNEPVLSSPAGGAAARRAAVLCYKGRRAQGQAPGPGEMQGQTTGTGRGATSEDRGRRHGKVGSQEGRDSRLGTLSWNSQKDGGEASAYARAEQRKREMGSQTERWRVGRGMEVGQIDEEETGKWTAAEVVRNKR